MMSFVMTIQKLILKNQFYQICLLAVNIIKISNIISMFFYKNKKGDTLSTAHNLFIKRSSILLLMYALEWLSFYLLYR